MPQAPHGGLMCVHQLKPNVTVEMSVPDGRVVTHHNREHDVTITKDQTDLITKRPA